MILLAAVALTSFLAGALAFAFVLVCMERDSRRTGDVLDFTAARPKQ